MNEQFPNDLLIGGVSADRELLYNTHYRAIYRYAYNRFSGDHNLKAQCAEETTVGAFAKTFSKPRCFQDEMHFVRYLIQIVKNLINDEYRTNELTTIPFHETDAHVPNFAPKVAQYLDIRQALSKLKPEELEVIWLHVVDRLTFREIAQRLAILPSQASSRYYKAKKKLRNLYNI